MKTQNFSIFILTVLGLMMGSPTPKALAIPIHLTSGVNGNMYTVEGEPGTAGTLGIDYALGTYLAGGNGGIGHGFKDKLAWHGHFCSPSETDCFVSTPSASGATGALEATDHNWLQGTTRPIVVDLGDGNASDQAIVFNSTDHLGFSTTYGDPAKDLWNKFIEGIEFTVYGTNDLSDALAAGSTSGVFGSTETGSVPTSGTGSTFEQGTLDYVFIDGWADFGATDEGDDFASVWQFSQPYRYIAVYSNFTDPLIGDGFRSFDNELDAIGRFLKPVGQPPSGSLPLPSSVALVAAGLLGWVGAQWRAQRSK